MCGIAGFFNPHRDYTNSKPYWEHILTCMNQVQKHRGPDDEGIFLCKNCGLAHVRLSILDLRTGHQPMTAYDEVRYCTIVHNGEIYNMKQLKKRLTRCGLCFDTTSDTEVLLKGYMYYGPNFVTQLNGIFAFAIYDSALHKLFLFRDHLGVKPLFYACVGEDLIFSSEIKGLFCHPDFSPVIDDNSLREIFGLGPARSYGKGVFSGVKELMGGCYLTYDKNGIHTEPFWQLTSHPHEDSMEETLEKTRFLITDSIQQQLLSDVPICTFLSGGVDSSIVTSVCASALQKTNQNLSTYSFDFVDNDLYFKASSFQPSQDRPWVDQMVEYCHSEHTYLYCTNQDQIDGLYQCVDARDLPCMADIESSMLYFCSSVSKKHKVALTGECADEIFGGYPWFHRPEFLQTETAPGERLFPWSLDMNPREAYLSQDVIDTLNLTDYAKEACGKTIAATPLLVGESPQEKRRREISYLNIRWFMATLLDRMDRTSMSCGLEARVPLADYRILEYVFNVPWTLKCPDGMVKGLLRKAMEGLLPTEVLFRPKSPYPKTYHPDYEKLLSLELLEILHNTSAPINTYLDKNKTENWLSAPSDYGRPFYGQLMAKPQQIAYLLQVNYWLEKWGVG